MSAHSNWLKFISALEARGVMFDQIGEASDRKSVITAAGFRDALEIAIIETEWASRVSKASSREALQQGHTGRTNPSTVDCRLLDDRGTKGLDAYAPEQLSTAPEEVQDGAVAVELLAALIGHPGAFFVLKGDASPAASFFEASAFVPIAMRTAVEPVLAVADAYRNVSHAEAHEFGAESLVAMALGECISEVAANYVHNVSELEKVARKRSMPLLFVCAEAQRIGRHVLRLSSLLPGLVDANGAPLHGGRLLNFLHEQHVKFTGSVEDERLLAVLLRRAARPYMEILRRWVQVGQLEDPFHEFFVAENLSSATSAGSGSGARATTLNMSIAAFRDLVAPTGTLAAPSANFQDSAGGEVPEVFQFDRRFMLDKSKIPTFFLSQGRVAKMVFYCGKYCCLVREYNGTLPDFTGLAAAEEEAWHWSHADNLHRVVEECYHRSCGTIIALLRSPEVDLTGHLQSLKDFFLHCRGDWLVDFLDSADEVLHKSPVQVKAHSIRVLLQTAIGKACRSDPYHALIGCSFADTTFAQYIELSLRQSGQPARGSGRLSTMHVETRRCIELLQLEAELRWPLTLLLDPMSMKHMNNVFRLLLWVKVCERSVNRWWNRSKASHATSGVSSRAHRIHLEFVQFLRQFQFFVAHFVIEPNWAKLMGRLASADDVLSMSHALQDFFENLEHGLILSNLTRFRHFARLLDLMMRFGDLGKAAGAASAETMDEMLKTVEDNFYRLLADLSTPKGEDYPQLVPMLTWIDFSRYYDKKNVYRVQSSSQGSSAAVGSGETSAMAAAKSQHKDRDRVNQQAL